MCDGKAEKVQILCARPNSIMTQYWRGKCDERWEVVVNIAKQILTETNDPTGGAVLYYAASMKEAPRWARKRVERRELPSGETMEVELQHGDLKTGTIKQIGSHIFGCSNFRGSDVCKGAAS
jgi:hypothetical protein